MRHARKRLVHAATVLLVVLSFTLAAAMARAQYNADGAMQPAWSYNTDYLYATIHGLNDMDIHPGLKITLVPVTLVLDTAFLPFAVVMGFFGH